MGTDRSPRIVTVVGRPVIDRYCHVDALPAPGDKALVVSRSTHFGGVADNFAVQAARLGASSAVVGEAGTDPESEAALAALEAEGVDISGLDRVVGRRPLVSDVVVDASGERVILVDLPEDLDASFAAVARVIERHATDADLVYLGAWQPALVAVVDALSRTGVAWACTVEAAVPPFEAPGLAAPLVVFGDEPAYRRHADTLAFIGARTVVVVTAGAGGSRSTLGPTGDPVAVPAVPAAVVDTTGAGDCFAATFAVHLLRGSSREESMVAAASAAAYSVGQLGSRTGPRASTPERRALGITEA